MDLDNIIPIVTDYGVRILGVGLALWASFKVARILGDGVTNRLEARKFDQTLSRFFGNIVRYLILISAVLACLSIFGIQTTSFAAILGAASLAIGMAFQGTLGNFSAGVLLLVFRPFKVGDAIKAGGEFGIVEELGLFVTTLKTLDNRAIFLPNSAVAGGTIENISAFDKRRVDIDVGCDYAANIDKTREVLEKAASSVEGRDPELGHQVFLASLGGSSVDWQLRIWCDADAYWDVYQDTIKQIHLALGEADIGIPYPTMDVNLNQAA